MEHYQTTTLKGELRTRWSFDGQMLRAFGVENPEQNRSQHALVNPGESVADALARVFPELYTGPNALRLQKLDMAPGAYFARMARQTVGGDSTSVNWGQNEDASIIAVSAEQLLVLISALANLCRTIHPDGTNLKTYGHEIRNLIILAATEVEAQMLGVLTANKYPPPKQNRFTTREYVRLHDAMRLDQYSIRFASYPWLNPISPFLGWEDTNPTKSLAWYHAYNKVKHDREKKFAEAQLGYAFDAVAAAFVMFVAQHGSPHAQMLSQQGTCNVFIASLPDWEIAKRYLGPEPNFSNLSVPPEMVRVFYPF